jgi:hypothetical protein
VAEGIPFTPGGIAAAYILNDHDVTFRRRALADVDLFIYRFVIGCSFQQHGKSARTRRTIDIRKQDDAIPHGDRHSAIRSNDAEHFPANQTGQFPTNQERQQHYRLNNPWHLW